MLAKKLAKNAKLDIAACKSGKGDDGKKLLKAIKDALAKNGRKDIQVILHEKRKSKGDKKSKGDITH